MARAAKTTRSTKARAPEDLSAAIALRTAGLEYRETHRREFVPRWYDWQREFFYASANHSQVMLLASNRSGKTYPGTYATALDVVGDYPKNWVGARITHPTEVWVLGVDALQTRNVLQKELLGEEGEDGRWRGGWIHADEIIGVERSHLPGAVSRAQVRHKPTGGVSTVLFKSYTQSSTGQSTLPLAGSSVDVMLIDEQPPDGIVGQLLTRTATGRRGAGGIVRYTMTPELGLTDLVAQFMSKELKHQKLIGPIAWSQCPHLSPQVQAELMASYPPHERDMRTKGIPLFGTGRVFRFDEDAIQIDPWPIQTTPWVRVIRALDIGIDHPTAIAWLVFDPDRDLVVLWRTYRANEQRAAIHASVANSMWKHAPLVVPHDIDGREPGSGETTRAYYEAAGITNALDFKNPDDSNYVEPGLFAMNEAIETGRFKVVRGQCNEFIEECRSYHRDEKGKVVKIRDDAICAVRYGFQMVRQFGVSVQPVSGARLYPELGLRTTARDERHYGGMRHGTRSGVR